MSGGGKGDGGSRGRDRVRIAVVGCGYIAQAEHIPCLLTARGLELAAIVEPRPRTRAALAERLAVPAFATMDELLSDDPALDAVDICATPMAHAPLVEAAAAAGKHILVEKPLCHSPSEAREMAETAERHGVHLMVGYMRRFDDLVLEAKRLLDYGAHRAPEVDRHGLQARPSRAVPPRGRPRSGGAARVGVRFRTSAPRLPNDVLRTTRSWSSRCTI